MGMGFGIPEPIWLNHLGLGSLSSWAVREALATLPRGLTVFLQGLLDV